jgi:hypothetical protein
MEDFGGVLSFDYHPPWISPDSGWKLLEPNDFGVRQDSGAAGTGPPRAGDSI